MAVVFNHDEVWLRQTIIAPHVQSHLQRHRFREKLQRSTWQRRHFENPVGGEKTRRGAEQ